MTWNCERDGHEIDDLNVRFVSMRGTHAVGEVYCLHCDCWSLADYVVDEQMMTWKEADDYDR